MGNPGIAARHLRRQLTQDKPQRVVDLGAGDGTFLLAVVRRLPASPAPREAVLVDRLRLLSQETAEEFRVRGWSIHTVEADAMDWLSSTPNGVDGILLANLFLHHFPDDQLRRLLGLVAARARLFVACEPRRTSFSLTGVALLPLIGCGAVSRHDARLSVCAGFSGRELSALWPESGEWTLREEGVGMFGHSFVAERRRSG